MTARAKLEVFNLSMLDTVTCALAGAIVLLLFFASRIPPEAQVRFDHVQGQGGEVLAAGDPPDPNADAEGTAAGFTHSIVAVYFTKGASQWKQGARTASFASCAQIASNALQSVTVVDPENSFDTNGIGESLGYAAWLVDTRIDNVVTTCVSIPVPSDDCKFFYIADAHTKSGECQGLTELRFEFREDERIFERVSGTT